MDCITYKAGYKYQLKRPYTVTVPVYPPRTLETPFLRLTRRGRLTIQAGYAWDGPSGPTFDTLTFMRASLVHDALYQLMREGLLDRNRWRPVADRLLRAMCREDGMCRWRAWYVYWAVRLFADPAADPAHDHPLQRAPRACRSAPLDRRAPPSAPSRR